MMPLDPFIVRVLSPYEIHCPWCNANPNCGCLTRQGHKARRLHIQRLNAVGMDLPYEKHVCFACARMFRTRLQVFRHRCKEYDWYPPPTNLVQWTDYRVLAVLSYAIPSVPDDDE